MKHCQYLDSNYAQCIKEAINFDHIIDFCKEHEYIGINQDPKKNFAIIDRIIKIKKKEIYGAGSHQYTSYYTWQTSPIKLNKKEKMIS